MHLAKMTILNFKGIKNLCLEFQGNNISIVGRNATGKSTILDAYIYCLFGKDSHDKQNFEIKTISDNIQENTNEHIVEVEFTEPNLVLKIIYSCIWRQRKSSPTPEFSGHTTRYFVNNLELQKNEFSRKIFDIFPEKFFKLLSNSTHFNTMHWKERRDILFTLIENITDNDVISSDKSLEELTQIIGVNSIDDHKKILASRQKTIMETLENIPVRISENQKFFWSEDTKSEISEFRKMLESLNLQKTAKLQELFSLNNNITSEDTKNKLDALSTELRNMRNDYESRKTSKIITQQNQLAKISLETTNLQIKKNAIEADVIMIQRKIEDKDTELSDMRNLFKIENSKVFDTSGICFNCGQNMPDNLIKEIKDEFNLSKSKTLELINANGNNIKKEIAMLKDELHKHNTNLETITNEYKISFAKKTTLLDDMNIPEVPLESDISFINLNKKYAELSEIVNKVDVSAIAQINNDISIIDNKIKDISSEISHLESIIRAKVRIDELKAEQTALADEHRELSRQLYLIEKFMKTKCSIVESKINKRFKRTRFKLFNNLDEECCETLGYNENLNSWVPWNVLNTGEKIHVGVDIISTLSKHFNVSFPLFVDNAESVTSQIEFDGQLIKLIAVPNVDELKIIDA